MVDVVLNVQFTMNGMLTRCEQAITEWSWHVTSSDANGEPLNVITSRHEDWFTVYDLYRFLLPQCEAQHTCHLCFLIATISICNLLYEQYICETLKRFSHYILRGNSYLYNMSLDQVNVRCCCNTSTLALLQSLIACKF